MNYYFLVEDEKSFFKVLPKWFRYMNFPLTRVPDIKSLIKDNYVLQSGQGVTQLVTKVLYETIETIIHGTNKVDDLIVVLDAEEEIPQSRQMQVLNKITEKYDITSLGFRVRIFVINRCFETWLLGCEKIYPNVVPGINSSFYEYYKHYNIEKDDPELMQKPLNLKGTTAKYHFHYLSELFRYNGKIQKIRMPYTKSNPQYVKTESYFKGIEQRIFNTDDLDSCRRFLRFIKLFRAHIVFVLYKINEEEKSYIELINKIIEEFEVSIHIILKEKSHKINMVPAEKCKIYYASSFELSEIMGIINGIDSVEIIVFEHKQEQNNIEVELSKCLNGIDVCNFDGILF